MRPIVFGIWLGVLAAAAPVSAQSPATPPPKAASPSDGTGGADNSIPPVAAAPSPEPGELSHEDMVKEQEQRDQEEEAERDRDDRASARPRDIGRWGSDAYQV